MTTPTTTPAIAPLDNERGTSAFRDSSNAAMAGAVFVDIVGCRRWRINECGPNNPTRPGDKTERQRRDDDVWLLGGQCGRRLASDKT